MLIFLPAGTNPYLTFHCVNPGTILLDLAPEDKEYQSVEEEVMYIRICHYLFLKSLLMSLFPREVNLPCIDRWSVPAHRLVSFGRCGGALPA